VLGPFWVVEGSCVIQKAFNAALERRYCERELPGPGLSALCLDLDWHTGSFGAVSSFLVTVRVHGERREHGDEYPGSQEHPADLTGRCRSVHQAAHRRYQVSDRPLPNSQLYLRSSTTRGGRGSRQFTSSVDHQSDHQRSGRPDIDVRRSFMKAVTSSQKEA
jgi:hypothetical protein